MIRHRKGFVSGVLAVNIWAMPMQVDIASGKAVAPRPDFDMSCDCGWMNQGNVSLRSIMVGNDRND
jgi:hypothetical protein